MKTITILITVAVFLVWSYSLIQGVTIKQNFYHCITMYEPDMFTDSEIASAIHYCELKSGYKANQELMP